MISPLQFVPRRDSTETRIVHDLSFPQDASVNSPIPSDSFLNEPYKLTLPGIYRLVDFVNRLSRGCHVFKNTSNEHIVKFLWIRLIIISLACVSMAHFIFTRLYLLVYDPPRSPANARPKHLLTFWTIMAEWTEFFSELGLQASPDKDTPPCCEMTCLGVQINTASMTLTVPQFRLHELQEELYSWFNDQFCTRNDLQRLLQIKSNQFFFWAREREEWLPNLPSQSLMY